MYKIYNRQTANYSKKSYNNLMECEKAIHEIVCETMKGDTMKDYFEKSKTYVALDSKKETKIICLDTYRKTKEIKNLKLTKY